MCLPRQLRAEREARREARIDKSSIRLAQTRTDSSGSGSGYAYRQGYRSGSGVGNTFLPPDSAHPGAALYPNMYASPDTANSISKGDIYSPDPHYRQSMLSPSDSLSGKAPDGRFVLESHSPGLSTARTPGRGQSWKDGMMSPREEIVLGQNKPYDGRREQGSRDSPDVDGYGYGQSAGYGEIQPGGRL